MAENITHVLWTAAHLRSVSLPTKLLPLDSSPLEKDSDELSICNIFLNNKQKLPFSHNNSAALYSKHESETSLFAANVVCVSD
jgi:hypothetical protein